MTKTPLLGARGAGCIGIALLLAACGSSHNGDAGAGPTQPEDAAASSSVAGLIGFAQGQIARPDADTSEPRAVAGISPPVSDVEEPAAI